MLYSQRELSLLWLTNPIHVQRTCIRSLSNSYPSVSSLQLFVCSVVELSFSDEGAIQE